MGLQLRQRKGVRIAGVVVNPYSVYDYLAFILPGSTLIFVSIYGWYGWPWGEPGASLLLGIVAAGFIVGNALAALGSWIEPMMLGARPGSYPDGLWGQFAVGDRYAGRKEEIAGRFTTSFGGELSVAYRLAQTELRNSGKGVELDRLNSQIGFYRGMSVAWLGTILVESAYAIFWNTHLLPGLWIPFFTVMFVLFVYRFRRFWRRYGDYVIREVLLMSNAKPLDSGTEP